ncbi:MAG TPA: dual specificity protein phosphatase family protein, partial [Chthoniobacterales bacterium]|nr:dual specificity protein phosphatase family protein [Chthoniobacterales bacterium]
HSRDGIVYVHCKIGYSRSAAAIGAWLLASGKARSIEEVFLIIYRARPSIIIRGEVVNAFRKFVSTLRRNEGEAFVLASAARAPA